jgi:hypothetical protein
MAEPAKRFKQPGSQSSPTFWQDHAMDDHGEIEHLSPLSTHTVRGRLAEDVLRLAWRGPG